MPELRPAAVPDRDLRSTLPDVDAPPEVEVGVMLLGMDADRLLTGLGLASIADDAGRVAVTVERLRHGGSAGALSATELLVEGARRWTEVRPVLAAACPVPSSSASIRRSWEATSRALDVPHLAGTGPATRVHLTTCWLRHVEVDARAAALVRPDPAR